MLPCLSVTETVLSPAQWDLMNTIRCSGETLLTLITDILDFSRIEADKMVLAPSEFHLQTVIEAAMEIAGLHAAQKRLQVLLIAGFVLHLVFLGGGGGGGGGGWGWGGGWGGGGEAVQE